MTPAACLGPERMRPGRTRRPVTVPIVAILGGGASGTLAAAQLARRAGDAGRRLDIVLIEPGRPGQGIAYSTTDERHRLNVPAAKMSAWPDEPAHFLDWLRTHVDPQFPAAGFAPRPHYARYLAAVLESAVSESAVSESAVSGATSRPGRVRVAHLAVRATNVRQQGRRLLVLLSDGTSRAVDAVVLALGHGVPSTAWAPGALTRSACFVPDPWADGAGAPRVRSGDDVVLVGAGLTAVDMAMRWARPGVRVHLASRHGMLPLAHSAVPATPSAAPELPAGLDLSAARRLVFDAIRNADGDWRSAIDGLRSVTGTLWRRLPEVDRRRFTACAARRWDRVRHRVAPATGEWLERRRAEGSLIVHSGGVVAASATGAYRAGAGPAGGVRPRTVRVELADGSVIDAAAVVNCTGAGGPITASADPLVTNLLRTGLAAPGPLDLGLATEDDGRVRGRSRAVWAIGPLRRGELWESTAIPEIRAQAAELATSVLAGLPDTALRAKDVGDVVGLPGTVAARVGTGAEAARRAFVDVAGVAV